MSKRKVKSRIYIAHECDGNRFFFGLREDADLGMGGDPACESTWELLADYLEPMMGSRPELADVWEFDIPSLLDHLFECAQMDDEQVCMSPEWYLEKFVDTSYEFNVPMTEHQRDYVFRKMMEERKASHA